MSVKHLFLGLLSQKSMHGYDLKASFDSAVFDQWNLNFGQVYTTLIRMERDGFVVSEGVVQGDKPDKKVYHITEKGRSEFKNWLKKKHEWNLYPDEIAFKFIAFQLVDQELSMEIVNSYRLYLLQLIKQLTSLKENSNENNLIQKLTIERSILRAEADLKWIELSKRELEG